MSELSLHMKKTVEATETNFVVMISSEERLTTLNSRYCDGGVTETE